MEKDRKFLRRYVQSLRDLPEMRNAGQQKKVDSVVRQIEKQSPALGERQGSNLAPQPGRKALLLDPLVYARVPVGQRLDDQFGGAIPDSGKLDAQVDCAVDLERSAGEAKNSEQQILRRRIVLEV